jgi:hypothetical protein
MNRPNPTVLLPPRATEDGQQIWRACVRLGWPTRRLTGWRVPEDLLATPAEHLIYGEPLFAEAVCDQLGLALLEASLDWLPGLPAEFRKREVRLTRLEEARQLTRPTFVKPAEGKTFEAAVYADGAALPTEHFVDGATPVLTSEIVDIQLEVRCFVRARKLMTLSPYWRAGESAETPDGEFPFLPGEEEQARAFLATLLEHPAVPLPPGAVIDLGRLANGDWLVIEANPCWGAGVYGCDPEQILHTIREAILPRAELADEMRRWVLQRN